MAIFEAEVFLPPRSASRRRGEHSALLAICFKDRLQDIIRERNDAGPDHLAFLVVNRDDCLHRGSVVHKTLQFSHPHGLARFGILHGNAHLARLERSWLGWGEDRNAVPVGADTRRRVVRGIRHFLTDEDLRMVNDCRRRGADFFRVAQNGFVSTFLFLLIRSGRDKCRCRRGNRFFSRCDGGHRLCRHRVLENVAIGIFQILGFALFGMRCGCECAKNCRGKDHAFHIGNLRRREAWRKSSSWSCDERPAPSAQVGSRN